MSISIFTISHVSTEVELLSELTIQACRIHSYSLKVLLTLNDTYVCLILTIMVV